MSESFFFHLCPSAFNVTDRDGNKVLDASTISYIQKVIDGFQNVLGS